MALFGAWKWRRERKQVQADQASKEIEASYEVLDPKTGTSAAADG